MVCPKADGFPDGTGRRFIKNALLRAMTKFLSAAKNMKNFLNCRKNHRTHSEIIGLWYIMNLQYGKRPDSARTADRKSINMSFRTSYLSWCGNLSYSRPRFKIRVIPNQCAHWCGNLPRTADRILKKRVIPNQCAHWCGNPPRTTGHVPKSVSFRTSPQTGVGIPRRTAGEYKIVNT